MEKKPLQISRVNSISDLDAHIDAWRELAAGAPMRSPEWLLTWWEIYASPDDELSILLAHDHEEHLVGLAPLYLQDSRGGKTFRLLGAADACTHHSTWLAATGFETQVGIEVARFLLKYKSDWKRLLFEAVDADAVAVHATMEHLAKNGCLCHQRQINSVWKISLPKTWDDYLMMLSRSHRKRCRKLQKQFLDSNKIKIRQVEVEADLQKGFEILLQLHGARWGGGKKTPGVFADKQFHNFHEIVAGKLLHRNQLRLAWLEYDGRPLAAEYQFFDAGSVYAYQAGIDLVMDEYSPGRLSMMVAIQFTISQGCVYFDLLRGDDPYKANWRAVPLPCYDLRAWQKSASGLMAGYMWQGYTLVVGLLKPIIPDPIIESCLKLFRR